ncbi:hypothetical protein [Paludisphaera soli]|uniref:hypothetical protein n=1 Tax=Paludisphaera soli TaxID=2712865 RepID=UPI0013EB9EE4|nr:hypothetical protein [Paludisphaera soli]
MSDETARAEDRYEVWLARLGRLGLPSSLLTAAGLVALFASSAWSSLANSKVGTPGRLLGAALVALAAMAFLCWCGALWNLGPDPDHARRLRLARGGGIWPFAGIVAMGLIPETAGNIFVIPFFVVTLVTAWHVLGSGRFERRRHREARRAADVGAGEAG